MLMLMKLYRRAHASFIPPGRGCLNALAAQMYLSARHMLKLEIGRKNAIQEHLCFKALKQSKPASAPMKESRQANVALANTFYWYEISCTSHRRRLL